MRYLLLVCLISLGLLNAQELSPSQSATLQNYNHSLSGKRRYKRKLQRLAEVSKDEAKAYAQKSCKAKEIETVKLTYRNRRLFYEIQTDECDIKIDALDGSVMEEI